jgi:hypothetical protein
MSYRLAAGAAVVAVVAAPGALGAQVLMERNVSAKMALTIAETALAECGSRVSVAVVDRAGRLRVFVQGDGAAPGLSGGHPSNGRNAPRPKFPASGSLRK